MLTPKSLKTSKPLNNLYRKLSGSLLSMAVKSQLIGDVPDIAVAIDQHTDAPSDQQTVLTFYVLKEYSRSNSVLIDLESQNHKLPHALATVVDNKHSINEKTAMVFLHHPKFSPWEKESQPTYSPRLLRLIEAVQRYPDLTIQLIPVTILWGRSPEKEDSIFNLLTNDDWQVPTIPKQLFNIGVKGRDTFVQFHAPKDLREILTQEAQKEGLKTLNSELKNGTDKPSHDTALSSYDISFLAAQVHKRLNDYLNKQQETILGPDLSDRRNVVDKILYTPAIAHAIEVDSQAKNHSIYDSRIQARQYLNEITSDYSSSVVRFFDRFLTWLWTQLYDGVEVHHFERVRAVASDYEIIYVPCHRSHMDYLLLSYVIYKRGLRIPYVAAGDNLNIPVLGQILRNGGAYFMRRSFKDNPLYGAVFREYMHSMISRNTPLEYFVEGGRSRTGRLLPPKKGMLAMTVQSHLRQASKPIAFIPTYIGYERIMEGGTYLGEMSGKPKESESLIGLLKTTRKIERIFGNVHVSFGKPLFLSDFMQKFEVKPNSLPPDRTDSTMPTNAMQMIDNLGIKIMQSINRNAVLNPVSLLSLVLLSTPKTALDEESCIRQLALYQRLAAQLPYDEDITVSNMSPQHIINYGIKLKLLERTPQVLGDIIRVAQGQAPLLSYFRNNILHVYILASLIASMIQRNGRMAMSDLQQTVEVMYPFLQAELFLKYAQRTLPERIETHINKLIEEGLIVDRGINDKGQRILSAPEPNTRNYQQLSVLANSVEQSLERYFMVLALLSQQGSGRMSKEQVIDLCHLLGQRLSVLYEGDMPDFFDRALFTSFLEALERLDYIEIIDGMIQFDKRVDNMAKNARFILDVDEMHILHQIAGLTDEEITRTLNQIQQKKQSRFSRKK